MNRGLTISVVICKILSTKGCILVYIFKTKGYWLCLGKTSFWHFQWQYCCWNVFMSHLAAAFFGSHPAKISLYSSLSMDFPKLTCAPVHDFSGKFSSLWWLWTCHLYVFPHQSQLYNLQFPKLWKGKTKNKNPLVWLPDSWFLFLLPRYWNTSGKADPGKKSA